MCEYKFGCSIILVLFVLSCSTCLCIFSVFLFHIQFNVQVLQYNVFKWAKEGGFIKKKILNLCLEFMNQRLY